MTQPYPAYPPASPDPGAGQARPVRPADLTVTVIGLVLLTAGALTVTALALVIGAFVEAVEPDSETGLGLATVLVPTWALWAVALGGSIALLVRRVLAFWVPLLALVVWVVVAVVVLDRG